MGMRKGSGDNAALAAGPFVCGSSHPGANWAGGIVKGYIEAQSTALPSGEYQLELQIDNAGAKITVINRSQSR